MKDTLVKTIENIGIIPVIKIDNAMHAVPLAKAVYSGGLRCVEITFRTDAAEESIRRICQEVPSLLVGAGTVLATGQVDRALQAGAKFIVTPGFNKKVVEYCIRNKVPIIPGISIPAEIEAALELGLNVLKFFPAQASGGVKTIKALSGPYGNVRFIPTGGINPDNLNEYLSFSKVLACGGSWMAPSQVIEDENFDEIERLVSQAIQAMLGFELRYVGIKCNTPEDTAALENGLLGTMIGSPKIEAPGEGGYIAIATNFIERAVYYLSLQGYRCIKETAKYDEKGSMESIFLEKRVGRYAIHLLQK